MNGSSVRVSVLYRRRVTARVLGSRNQNLGLPDPSGIGGHQHFEHALAGAKLNIASPVATDGALFGRVLQRLCQPFSVLRIGADVTKHVGCAILDLPRSRTLARKLEREEEFV